MLMPKTIEPAFAYELDGYLYLGRGTGGGGWRRSKCFYYRCAQCGDMMRGDQNDYFNCECNAMHLDIDAGRFGSTCGDQNILRYQKMDGNAVESLMDLWSGSNIEVIQEFRDYDGKSWPVGEKLLSFKQYNCVPYHGGYTFMFENANLRFCDNVPENVGVFSHFQQYFRVTGTDYVSPTGTSSSANNIANASAQITLQNSAKLKGRAKITLVITSGLMLLASPALLAALLMSIAAPGGSPFTVLLPAIITAAPYATITAGWIFYTRKNYRRADLCAKLPLALFVLFFLIGTATTFIGSSLGFPTLKRTTIVPLNGAPKMGTKELRYGRFEPTPSASDVRPRFDR
jgi:hypothetical protein